MATYVQLQVRDTGSGIPAARLAQIFEPLYTTPEREVRVKPLKMRDQYLSRTSDSLPKNGHPICP